MNFGELAIEMFPYWILGLFMMFITMYTGNKDILRVDFKAVGKWCLFLLALSVYRFILFKFIWTPEHAIESFEPVRWIPWQATLTVFWEDAAHTLPLLLLMRLIGTRWFVWPIHIVAILAMTAAFGSGHTYQGYLSALILSLYVPLSLNAAKKNGLGTIMVCHVLYDLSTVAMIQYILRAM